MSPGLGNWDDIPWERVEPGIRESHGAISGKPYGEYPGWSWRQGNRYDSAYIHCEIHVELLDFDTASNPTNPRYPVLSLDDPVRGKRLMFVVLSCEGSELRDITKITPGDLPPFETTNDLSRYDEKDRMAK